MKPGHGQDHVADDVKFMQRALDLARKGLGTTSPNPMVGAVVVRDKAVVGEGFHEKAGGPHAEVAALDQAGPLARGATLYVTLEPCNHTGRTGPCTRRILESGVAAVIAAMKDPNPDVAGHGLAFLRNHGVQVSCGLLEDQAARLNEFFVKWVTTKLPFVIAKAAATLDGRIATRTGDSQWITNEAARQYAHRLRHAVDAVLVGAGTVLADNPRLTTRLQEGGGRDPKRVILDAHLSIPPDARVLRASSDSDTLIYCGPDALPHKKAALCAQGAKVLEVPADKGRVDIRAVCLDLGKREVQGLLIEGGARVHAAALSAGVVDKICFIYAPKILGGDDGVPMFAGPAAARIADAVLVQDIAVSRFGDDVMIEGYLVKG